MSFLAPLSQSPEPGAGTHVQILAPAWPSNTGFEYDWNHLSRWVLNGVQTSPPLGRSADCIHRQDSQACHSQRDLTNEADHLKTSLNTYWNDVLRGFMSEVKAEEYKERVRSGIWTLRAEDRSQRDCSDRLARESNALEGRWRDYYQQRILHFQDLLKQTDDCDACRPQLDTRKSEWASGGG